MEKRKRQLMNAAAEKRIYLVRHGKAAAGWGEAIDPGLDETGIKQASRVAEKLAPEGPLNIVSSPLKRARETASFLAGNWQQEPKIEARVGEIPFPQGITGERITWLRGIMQKRWCDLDHALNVWRENVGQALCDMKQDAVVFTHFIVINAAVGLATGDDRVVIFAPDNCSVTILKADRAGLELVAYGDEAVTRIG